MHDRAQRASLNATVWGYILLNIVVVVIVVVIIVVVDGDDAIDDVTIAVMSVHEGSSIIEDHCDVAEIRELKLRIREVHRKIISRKIF